MKITVQHKNYNAKQVNHNIRLQWRYSRGQKSTYT
uniref:Uncharacterized protein n=1 Tax=Anguilla anguilla TaxID=7936 RepID=A0A0E9XVL5_ANGAN